MVIVTSDSQGSSNAKKLGKPNKQENSDRQNKDVTNAPFDVDNAEDAGVLQEF